jgi:hypothetical protein
MKSKKDIAQLTDQVMNSLDGVQRAETQPFFYTRLMARMEGAEMNGWNRWMAFLSRPAVSLALLLVFLMINGYLIFSRLESQPEMTAATSDYAVMQVSYIDPNPELP